ncbi:uncharacterized protein Bfra_002502 [Botrytis fragariae]|uniref:Uncharacterized protein n=1 Tax=Botrytis fragariae TaxID=1964551 RepID=A0A8H6AYZ5_9HELO|nr:uncharacterized protein Bfra_002502 [Botrytis fragariae]KAF5876102.1 hypothetical protein Bfra_002502 [Botrytis fragariae]
MKFTSPGSLDSFYFTGLKTHRDHLSKQRVSTILICSRPARGHVDTHRPMRCACANVVTRAGPEYQYFDTVLRVRCRFSACHGALRLVLRELRADVAVFDIVDSASFEAFCSLVV